MSKPRQPASASRRTVDRQSPGKRRMATRAMQPVVGMEAEFTLYVQDEQRKPEHVFRDPQEIVRQRMLPRTGKSFHLPSGGALYFDTGVIEVATPIIELEPGCSIRVVRSLWEQISFVRAELDAWEERTGNKARLEGFSTHYNISTPEREDLGTAGMRRLALFLTYLIPAPCMLLLANRLSTGIGVRPREGRLEVTADFTPDPNLMSAGAAFVFAALHEVASWPAHDLHELTRRAFPVIGGFHPRKHTSRKGFLAKNDCYPRNPFQCDPTVDDWQLVDGGERTLREIAVRIADPFSERMATWADAETADFSMSVLEGHARSLLDFPERPDSYSDAGRGADWSRRRHIERLPRSKYEQVIHRILTHRPLAVASRIYRAERMHGWYEVIFREVKTGRKKIFNLDELVLHCSL